MPSPIDADNDPAIWNDRGIAVNRVHDATEHASRIVKELRHVFLVENPFRQRGFRRLDFSNIDDRICGRGRVVRNPTRPAFRVIAPLVQLPKKIPAFRCAEKPRAALVIGERRPYRAVPRFLQIASHRRLIHNRQPVAPPASAVRLFQSPEIESRSELKFQPSLLQIDSRYRAAHSVLGRSPRLIQQFVGRREPAHVKAIGESARSVRSTVERQRKPHRCFPESPPARHRIEAPRVFDNRYLSGVQHINFGRFQIGE